MSLRNRVTPLGEIVSHPARGLVYGNRGCLHDAQGRIRRPYAVKRWIVCRLEFKGRRRAPLLQPGRYTELFFLDESTAFAAGHRPCAECRWDDYRHFGALWPGEAGADAIDARLHAERIAGRERIIHAAHYDELPDGAFVLHDGAPQLVLGERLLAWSPAGYTDARPRPRGPARLITPPSLVAVLRAGWEGDVPLLHGSAAVAAG
jgi:hypothetical protein